MASALLRNPAEFRSDVVEALTWALVTRLDRQPLHAAAIARHDAVLLLYGPAGAGKSTLALATTIAGIEAVADDMVFLQSTPRFGLWTRASEIHVLPEAAARLRLDTRAAGLRVRNGVGKLAVKTGIRSTRSFARSGLCLLGPRVPTPRATELGPANAVARIDLRADPGFDHFADTIGPLIENVASGGAWLLEPSVEPAASVPHLAEMLARVSEGGR